MISLDVSDDNLVEGHMNLMDTDKAREPNNGEVFEIAASLPAATWQV